MADIIFLNWVMLSTSGYKWNLCKFPRHRLLICKEARITIFRFFRCYASTSRWRSSRQWDLVPYHHYIVAQPKIRSTTNIFLITKCSEKQSSCFAHPSRLLLCLSSTDDIDQGISHLPIRVSEWVLILWYSKIKYLHTAAAKQHNFVCDPFCPLNYDLLSGK